jgi:Protein of unknown function (DUF2380)
MRRSMRALALGAAIMFAGPAAAETITHPDVKPIAVVDFDYRDTSGEARDQSAEHRARLGAFMAKLRADLGADPRFPVATIACANPPCTAGNTPPKALMDAARQAGAYAVLYGEIDKMSTLVQWGRVQLVDVAADKLLDDKFLTFRGDTDEAWLRAEAFIVEELKAGDFAQ